MNRHALQKTILVAAAILVLFAVFQQAAVACPTCRNGLAEGEENVKQLQARGQGVLMLTAH